MAELGLARLAAAVDDALLDAVDLAVHVAHRDDGDEYGDRDHDVLDDLLRLCQLHCERGGTDEHDAGKRREREREGGGSLLPLASTVPVPR